MLFRRNASARLKSTVIHGMFLALIFVLIAVGCKDPDEYDPTQPLDPPPGPPNLLFPLPDTNLCSSSLIQNVFFDWNTVSGSEVYQIQADSIIHL